MILSFAEFNALYESYNDSEMQQDEYNDGAEVLESLFTVINKRGSLSEEEVATFLNNVLEETGWELNDEVYENYLEWLEEYSSILDESYTEDGYVYSLTKRGERMIQEGIGDAIKGMGGKIAGSAKGIGGKIAGSAKGLGGKIAGSAKDMGTKFNGLSKGKKIAVAAGGAAALGGAALGARALIKRRQAKKAAAAQAQAPAHAPAAK